MVEQCKRAHDAGVSLLDKNATFEGYPVGQWFHDVWRGRTNLTPDRIKRLRDARIF